MGRYLKYQVSLEEIKELDKPRPLGISGHLRCKDEGLSLRECIKSCLPFLDELIITYQDSKDDTEAIVKELAAKFPDKIRAFYYAPKVQMHRYFDRQNSRREHTSVDDINGVANFYNYGLVRIKYRYYVKIDGDQVYFENALLRFRAELLGAAGRVDAKGLVYKTLARALLRVCLRGYKGLSSDNYFLNLSLYTCVLSGRVCFTLGGINVCVADDKEGLYVYDEWKARGAFEATSEDSDASAKIDSTKAMQSRASQALAPLSQKPFPSDLFKDLTLLNGCGGDTKVFIPTSKTFYYFDTKKGCESIDVMAYHRPAGLFWLHFGMVKNGVALSRWQILCTIEDFMAKRLDEQVGVIFTQRLYSLFFTHFYTEARRGFFTREFKAYLDAIKARLRG